MRLLDVNILLYAVDATSPFHERVRTWFEERMSGAETAIEHGAMLCSADEDFDRFPGLNRENPLRP